MAHSKQAAKRNRQNIKAREKNKKQRTAFKSALKRVQLFRKWLGDEIAREK